MVGTSWQIEMTKIINTTGTPEIALRSINEFNDPLLTATLQKFPWETVLSKHPFKPLEATTFDSPPMASFILEVDSSLFPSVGGRLRSTSKIRTFVDMMPLQDVYGLDLRLIVLTPEIDFNMDFTSTMAISEISIAIVIVLMVLFSGLLAYNLLSPLADLAESMEVVESLQVGRRGINSATNPERSFSKLSEIFLIQMRYHRLRQQLQRVVTYLPQAVVLQLLSDRRDDHEHEEEGEGEEQGDSDFTPTEHHDDDTEHHLQEDDYTGGGGGGGGVGDQGSSAGVSNSSNPTVTSLGRGTSAGRGREPQPHPLDLNAGGGLEACDDDFVTAIDMPPPMDLLAACSRRGSHRA